MKILLKTCYSCVFIALFATVSMASITINLNKTAQIDESSILLGSIAKIESDDDKQLDLISSVRLGRSPELDNNIIHAVTQEKIRTCLALAGFTKAQYRLSGATEVLVRRVDKVKPYAPSLVAVGFEDNFPPLEIDEPTMWDILPDADKQALLDASTGYNWNLAKIEAEVKSNLAKNLKINADFIELKRKGNILSSSRKKLEGRMLIKKVEMIGSDMTGNTLECFVEMLTQPFADVREVDRFVEKFQFTIQTYKLAVVANRQLSRNTIITADDVRVDKVAVSSKSSYESVDQVIGKILIRSIRNDQMITDQIKVAPLVEKKSSIIYKSRLTRSTERGIALSEGGLGDIITMQVTRGGKKVRFDVKVIGPGQVGSVR